jgi:hypothetical protein
MSMVTHREATDSKLFISSFYIHAFSYSLFSENEHISDHSFGMYSERRANMGHPNGDVKIKGGKTDSKQRRCISIFSIHETSW